MSLSITLAENPFARLLRGIWYRITAPSYFQELRAGFAPDDLFSQAEHLYKAGYFDASMSIANMAIAHMLRKTLHSLPDKKRRPCNNTSSWSNAQTHEITFLLFNLTVIDDQLRRDINQFRKKAQKMDLGTRLQQRKAARMNRQIRALKPRLEAALLRAAAL